MIGRLPHGHDRIRDACQPARPGRRLRRHPHHRGRAIRERFPDRSLLVLEGRDHHGGTWWTHWYPGVRSDSDLFTYGFRFKPWRGTAIATGPAILSYLDEVIAEDGLDDHIRYLHRVTAAV